MQVSQETPVIFSVPLFKNLSVLAKEELIHLSQEKKYKKNEFVYLPDDELNHMHLLISGRLKTGIYSSEGKEIIQNIVAPGELFGEQVLISDEDTQEFSQVISANAVVLSIPLSKVRSLVQNNPAMSMQYAKLIAGRLKKAERRLESMVFKNARSRIIDFIKDLANERGKRIGFETLVYNYLTHMEIANLTATSRQTVTTVLNELKTKNLIYFDRKRILIRDLEKLA